MKVNFTSRSVVILLLVLIVVASMSTGDAPFTYVMRGDNYEELTMAVWIYMILMIVIALAAVVDKYQITFWGGIISLILIIIIDIAMHYDLGFTGFAGLISSLIIILIASKERVGKQ